MISLQSRPSSTGFNTAAPAPSPHRIQLSRSVQSRVRLITSEATTRAFLKVPVFKYCSATESPKIKPLQAATTSKETALSAPSLASNQFAPDGQAVSGVMVQSTMSSTSVGVIPAISMALIAASLPRSEAYSSASAILRSRTPVRLLIHSSEV